MTGYQFEIEPNDPPLGTVLALVPDGVGAVSFAFARPQPALPLAVTNNLASAPAPLALSRLAHVGVRVVRSPRRLRAAIAAGLPTSVTWYDAPGGRSVHAFARPASMVDDLVKVIRAGAASLQGATVSGSSGSCTPATVDGHRVERCRTCTFKIVNGQKRDIHCTSSARRTS